jgi:hypothetical protein
VTQVSSLNSCFVYLEGMADVRFGIPWPCLDHRKLEFFKL